MIAADTSTWIAFLQGDEGEDVGLLDQALSDRQVLMVPVVPVVLAELLSDPKLPPKEAQILMDLPLLPVEEGYWQRVGALRAAVLRKSRRARLGDALIVQSCVDRAVPLLTRDRDFFVVAEAAKLDLLIR